MADENVHPEDGQADSQSAATSNLPDWLLEAISTGQRVTPQAASIPPAASTAPQSSALSLVGVSAPISSGEPLLPTPEIRPSAAEEIIQPPIPLRLPTSKELSPPRSPDSSHPKHLAYSTLLSLVVVLVLLVAVRLIVPSLVENIRYGWHRGQLRAEYEMSGQHLRSVSLDSLADVSRLVSQRVGPSVVHINLLHDLTEEEVVFAHGGSTKPFHVLEGQGSGFVVDSAGYILTNHHVIEGTGRIQVTTSDGRRLDAYIAGSDPPTDLALLKVEASGLMPIDWGDSDRVTVGSPVWAVGSPYGLQQTVTFGIISGMHRAELRGTRYDRPLTHDSKYQPNPFIAGYGDLMQSDVALNPGNSGGPLANAQGEVIGVNAAILGDSYQGISFSIPAKVARRVVQDLIADGEVQRGWLGISMRDLSEEQRYDNDGQAQPGVVVVGFPETGPSPAREAGLLAGDIIVAFNDRPVMNQVELMRMIGESAVGSGARLEIKRGDEVVTITVALGKRVMDVNPAKE